MRGRKALFCGTAILGIITNMVLVAPAHASAAYPSTSTTGSGIPPAGPFPSSPTGLVPPSSSPSSLPHAGPPVGGSHGGGRASPAETRNNCFGASEPNPPTAWEAIANSYFSGGASGFESDMSGIANLMASLGYTYMSGEVSTIADLEYFGSIACRENTFGLVSPPGDQYLGMFQLSVADFVGILGSSCSAYAFENTGCDGFSVIYTQMIGALYYCENHYGGNPYGGWFSEIFRNYW